MSTCPCKANNWVRMPGSELGAVRLPMSNHHPDCPAYELEEFAKVTIDGTSCVLEPDDVASVMEGIEGYTVAPTYMTRDQFDNLPEFEGF